MAGWVRLRGALQVRPCKLGRRIHAAHAPATGPTPPSTGSRDLPGLRTALLLVGVDLVRHVSCLWWVTTVGRHQSEATRFCFSIFFFVAGRARNLSEAGRVGHAGALAPWMAPSSLQGRTCSVPCMAHPSGQARDPLCATNHEGLSRSRPTPHPAHAGDQRSRHRSSARDGAALSSTPVP